MSRTMTSLLAGSALVAAAAAGIAGCSSNSASPSSAASSSSSASSNSGLSGDNLLTAFKSAAGSASAVHVSGSIDEGGTPISLDLNLNKSGSTTGTVSESGTSVPIKVVGGVTYIQLTPTLLKQEAASDQSITAGVINLIENKWVSSQSSIGQSLSSSFQGLTNYNDFLATIESGTTPSSGSSDSSSSSSGSAPISFSDLTAAGTTQYNGGTVAVYNASDGSTAYFAATGPAYLEKVTATGSTSGTLTFTWNQPVTVTAPAPSDIFTG